MADPNSFGSVTLTFDLERCLTNSLEQTSDLELARLASNGDESAFAEIMRRYSPRVFRVASRFFRERESG